MIPFTYFFVDQVHVVKKTFLEGIGDAAHFTDKLLLSRVDSHVIFQTLLSQKRHLANVAAHFLLLGQLQMLLVVVRAFNLQLAKFAVDQGSVTGNVLFQKSLGFVRLAAHVAGERSLVGMRQFVTSPVDDVPTRLVTNATLVDLVPSLLLLHGHSSADVGLGEGFDGVSKVALRAEGASELWSVLLVKFRLDLDLWRLA